MTARLAEIVLGLWLLASILVFRHEETNILIAANEAVCGFLGICFSTLSFWSSTEKAHRFNLAIAVWLILFGIFSDNAFPPASLNQIIIGLLLGITAMIPNKFHHEPIGRESRYETQKQ